MDPKSDSGVRVPLPALLRQVEIFGTLGEEEREAIASRLEFRRVRAGEPVFREGDPSDGLYVVHSGEVGVVAEGRGDRRVLARLSPGQCFGEMSLLTGEPRSTSIYATLDSELLFLRDTAFEGLLRRWPAVALALGRTLSLRLRRANVASREERRDRILLCVSASPQVSAFRVAADLAGALAACRGREVLVVDLERAPEAPAGRDPRGIRGALLDGEAPSLREWAVEIRQGVRALAFASGAGTEIERKLLGPLLGLALTQFGGALVAVAGEGPDRGLVDEALRQCDAALLLVQPDHAATSAARQILDGAGGSGPLADKWRPALIRPPEIAPGTVAGIEARLGHPVAYHLVTGDPSSLARLARRLNRSAVGLALGGGGARGLAHLGILEVLLQEGIPIDVVGGTSIGSILAALFALGHPPGAIGAIVRREWVDRNPLNDFTLPFSGLIRGRRGEKVLRRVMGETRIEDLPAPYFAVAADLVTAEEVVLHRGPLWLAVRASGSIPVLLTPVRDGRRFLVDGGVINNVPGDHLARFGADVSIAVDVTPRRESYFEEVLDRPARAGALGRLARRSGMFRDWFDHPGILRTLRRIVAIEGLEIMKTKAAAFDLCIQPDVEGFDLLDFKPVERLVEAGREAGRRALPDIRRKIAEAAAGPPRDEG